MCIYIYICTRCFTINTSQTLKINSKRNFHSHTWQHQMCCLTTLQNVIRISCLVNIWCEGTMCSSWFKVKVTFSVKLTIHYQSLLYNKIIHKCERRIEKMNILSLVIFQVARWNVQLINSRKRAPYRMCQLMEKRKWWCWRSKMKSYSWLKWCLPFPAII